MKKDKLPKIVTMYLPQYHKTKENDEWWGDGFTDWMTVKGANRLFDEHIQPVIPYGEYYYDLSKKSTFIWQVEQMKKYGVYGQCFYHYYFENGKLVLNQPVENLLKWKEINMPFCFCWANESWIRSWESATEGNVWTHKYENENKSDGVLLNQDYGYEEDWIKHYNYLQQFFLDDRYIKIDGKPVFIIYKPDKIDCFSEMIALWRQLAQGDGFKDLFIIGTNSVRQDITEVVDANYYHEPLRTNRIISLRERGMNYPVLNSYDTVWNVILSNKMCEEKTFYGGFVGYDDTPRHNTKGTVIWGANPDKFEFYLANLIARNVTAGNEIVFINAWNEWGEGMHLEPDTIYAFKYLEAIPKAINDADSYIDRYRFMEKYGLSGYADEMKKRVDILRQNRRLFELWMCCREHNINILAPLAESNVNKMVIYGCGTTCKHLIEDVKASKIKVEYGIDRKKITEDFGFPIITIEEVETTDVDVVVVAVLQDDRQVVNMLMKYGFSNVISIKELISNAYECCN